MVTNLERNMDDQHQHKQAWILIKKTFIPLILFSGKVMAYKPYPELPDTAVQV
jgi:hypothetical protein